MSHQPLQNILPFFTEALKSFQHANATFRVLCSIVPPCHQVLGQNEVTPQPPRQPPASLLVLDSSFNPPTLAHQRMTLSALGEHKYRATSRVLLLLAVNNADKAPKPAAFSQRLAMMYTFALDLLSASAEAAEAAVDIAVTTEPYFHSKSNAIAASDFYSGGEETAAVRQLYLTGFDTLIRIFDPKYYADMKQALDPFFSRSQLWVTMRTDADWGDAMAQLAYLDGLREGGLEECGGRKEWAEQVTMFEGCRQNEGVISSTKARDATEKAQWEVLNQLVSATTARWIRQEALYKKRL